MVPVADTKHIIRGRTKSCTWAGALAALAAADPSLAADHLTGARAAIRELAAWQSAPTVLAVWLQTTGDLLDAVDAMAAAVAAGDSAGLARARQRYADAAALARQADTALAVALSEGGAAITRVPLSRLARLLADIGDLRSKISTLLGP